MADVTVTAVTLARSRWPAGSLLNAVMAGAKTVPFCSRATRCAVGVLALKNFSQFAVICAAADTVGEAAAEDAGAEVEGADEPDDELELQAATVTARARASAAARMTGEPEWVSHCASLVSVGGSAEGGPMRGPQSLRAD